MTRFVRHRFRCPPSHTVRLSIRATAAFPTTIPPFDNASSTVHSRRFKLSSTTGSTTSLHPRYTTASTFQKPLVLLHKTACVGGLVLTQFSAVGSSPLSLCPFPPFSSLCLGSPEWFFLGAGHICSPEHTTTLLGYAKALFRATVAFSVGVGVLFGSTTVG